MRHLAKLLVGITLGVCSMSAPTPIAAAPATKSTADVAMMRAVVEAAYPIDGPGAAVIVTRRGRVVLASERGLADVETRRPIETDTAFRLGSITKQFTAAVVLKLVAEGRLSLDDPLSRFFPDWPNPSARATVQQLLNHTSGIQDYSKIPGWMGGEQSMRANSTADLAAVMRSAPAVSRPGTRWEYNNGGYMMLGAIIEQVTGMPWYRAVIERIGRPLGLRSLAYAAAVEPPAVARGYSMRGGRQQPARGVHISVAHAAGGLVASASDLARWADALHHGRVVSPAHYAEMTRPARLANGSTEPYGFGLRLGEIRGVPVLDHGGSGRGIDTDAAFIPQTDTFIAVLANSDSPATDPSVVVRRLAAATLGDPLPTFHAAAVDPATLETAFGTYGVNVSPPRRFFARDGKLYIARGDEELEVLAAGDGRFFRPDGLTWFRIVQQQGRAPAMELHRIDEAGVERTERTGPVPPPLTLPADLLLSYVGTYATEVPVLTVALDAAGRLTIAAAEQAPAVLRPVSATEFRIEGTAMRVVFVPENGRVERLTLYRGARELHGRRIR